MNLHDMKERIEMMPKHYQIEIGKLLIKQYECSHNENQNGIFINLSNISLEITQKLQNLASDIALGPDCWIKHPEFKGMDIKKIAPIITNAALKRSQIYSAAIDDAEFRAIFKPWLKQYTDSLMKVLKIAQPDIDRINADVKTAQGIVTLGYKF